MRTTLLGLGLAGLWAALAAAAPADAMPEPAVGPLQVLGPDCTPPMLRGGFTVTSDQRLAYGITFLGHQAVAQDQTGTNAAWACGVQVALTPPPGYQMRIATFGLSGSHRTLAPASTQLNASYFRTGPGHRHIGMDLRYEVDPSLPASEQPDPRQDGQHLVSLTGPGVGAPRGPWDAKFSYDMAGDDEWSPCGQPLTLESAFDLSAARNGSAQMAEIALDIANASATVVWGWEFRPCGDQPAGWLDGRWSSAFSRSGGPPTQAVLDVRGELGTFRTDHFVGRLYRLSYQGDAVRGRWDAPPNQGGWFVYTRRNGAFVGEWGYGQDGGAPSGRWWGQR